MVIKWLSDKSALVIPIVTLLLIGEHRVNGGQTRVKVDNFSNVVRIDLEKHFIPHQEIEELEEEE